eukprot:gene7119-biopygen5666
MPCCSLIIVRSLWYSAFRLFRAHCGTVPLPLPHPHPTHHLLFGKGGATKDKIAAVAGCEIELTHRGPAKGDDPRHAVNPFATVAVRGIVTVARVVDDRS